MKKFLCLALFFLGVTHQIFGANFQEGTILVKTAVPWGNTLSASTANTKAPVDIVHITPIVIPKNKSHRLFSTHTHTPTYIYKIAVPKNTDIVSASSALIGTAIEGNFILAAEPNYVYHLFHAPQDAFFYAEQSPSLSLIHAQNAWALTTGNASVVIAVLDSGINTTHIDLKDNLWKDPAYMTPVYGKNTVPGAPSTTDVSDVLGHGTHVSGIIAAKGLITAGLCPNCDIMPIKITSGNLVYNDAILSGLAYAIDNNAHIVSMSFGGGFHSGMQESEIQRGHDQGVVFVAAIGNDNLDANISPVYPAAYPHVLGIGAVDNNGQRASFSNYGDYMFLSAPGVSIYSSGIPSTNSAAIKSGTSMATPHVSGAIALMRSLMPWLTAAEIKTALRLSAQDRGTVGYDRFYGYGILHAENAIRYADTLPPTLSALSATPTSAPFGSPTVSVSVTDNLSIGSVSLHYRYDVQNLPISGWQSVPMTATSTRYIAQIPAPPAITTAIRYFVSAKDLHPNNPSYIPIGASSSPNSILYPNDIVSPNIIFIGKNNDFVGSQVQVWVTDNYTVVTSSITVAIASGVDTGQVSFPHSALGYTTGLLTITLPDTGIALPAEGEITVTVSATDLSGNTSTKALSLTRTAQTSIVDAEQKSGFLFYPNPCDPIRDTCVFSYSLSKDAQLEIRLYSLKLQEVQHFLLTAPYTLGGYHEYVWDGRAKDGTLLPNGTYLAIMTATIGDTKKIFRQRIALKR